MGKRDHRGNRTKEHGTFVRRELMSSPAWRAMSPKAQVLYIWLRLEFKGANFNNNGKIRLSYRQAAQRIGITVNTAMQAFHELQSKGFIVVTRLGALGVEGEARGPTYELTDIGLPNKSARLLYRAWKPGKDFKVVRHQKHAER
jgi:DNA-binding transcriptional MocR family regulator